MKRRIERAPLPDAAMLRALVSDRASELREGAILVDGDAQGSTGVDLLMVDETGRPIFVDVVTEGADGILARVFEHLAWVEENRRLFLRAYGRDGVRDDGVPEIIFVSGSFPRGVLRALPMLRGAAIRLLKAEYFVVDGEGELILEEVARTTDAPRAASPDAEVRETRPLSRLEDGIESESVLGLLKLFKSGVDGLDARITETESNGGVAFELSGRRLAKASVSPGSFTVTPGDQAANPIVVSDRVSLERALNAVVSLFVRGGQSGFDDAPSSDGTLDETERSELAGIWGGGLGNSEN